MLQRIIAIFGIGRFRNSAHTPNPPFQRQTMIFAPNGYGKTTLSAILRSFQSGDPAPILARQSLGITAPPAVNLLWNGAQRQFRDGAWSAAEPLLSIFDGVFVAENVHSGDVVDVANRRNLYRVIVGRDGIGLAAEEARLAEEGRALQGTLGPGERAVEAISGGIAAKAFVDLPPDEEIDEKLRRQRAALAAQREATAISERQLLTTLELPTLAVEIGGTLRRGLDGVADDAEARIAQHVQEHGLGEGGEDWLARGAAFPSGDDCPFCGRDGLEALELVRDYRALFGDGYRQLRVAIDETYARHVDAVFGAEARGAMGTRHARNEGGLEFWSRHCEIDRDGLVAPDAAVAATAEVYEGLKDVFAAKAAQPLEPFDGEVALHALEARLAEAVGSLKAYNAAVEAANVLIESKKRHTAIGDVAAVQAELDRLERIARRHSAEGTALCTRWHELDTEKTRINAAKAAVRRQLEDHCARVVRPYEGRINHYLALFNAGFTIAQVGHAYPGGIATSTDQAQKRPSRRRLVHRLHARNRIEGVAAAQKMIGAPAHQGFG